MKVLTAGIRRWLIAENKEDAAFVELLYWHGRGWAAYSSDGFNPYGAIAFDFPPEKEG